MSDKIIPIDKLVTYKGNIYEVTMAMVEQAKIISENGCDEVTENKGKICSTAIKQVLEKRVEFKNEEE